MKSFIILCCLQRYSHIWSLHVYTGLLSSDGKKPVACLFSLAKQKAPGLGHYMLRHLGCIKHWGGSHQSWFCGRAGRAAQDIKIWPSGLLLKQTFNVCASGNWDWWCFGSQALHFVKDLGCRLWSAIVESNSLQFLIQRLSMVVQRGNAGSVLGTIGQQDGLVDF